jgi:hypothetical protein
VGARVVALTTTHTADALRDAEATIADFRSVRVEREGTGLGVRF